MDKEELQALLLAVASGVTPPEQGVEQLRRRPFEGPVFATTDHYRGLPGMLNSCASGVTVVNIDNGFSAVCAAGLMNRGSCAN